MSEYSTPEQRTEMPTGRRMSQLRKDGQVHLSFEVVQVISILAGFFIMSRAWSWLMSDMKSVFISSFRMENVEDRFTPELLLKIFLSLVYQIGPKIIIIVGFIALFSSLAVMLQTKWNIKEKKIKFEFPHLNPLAGIKKIFSMQGSVNTLKAIVKLAIILPIGYLALKKLAPAMIMLIHMSIEDIFLFTGRSMRTVFWRIMYILIALAIVDYFWTRYQWLRQNKMTKDEVKDERKAVEGDEETRKKIQAKGIQRIMQRLKINVPKADVVVRNPTHYAVALKYDRATMSAPEVVAKGKNFLALRIIEIAKEAGVPVLERRTLARALYSSTEVGAQIPADLFKAVAEVLVYVYRLKNRYFGRAEATAR